MKVPPIPPDYRKLFDIDADQPEKFDQILEAKPPTGYRHWDKVRFLPPPDGITNEQWWYSIKWRRSGQMVSSPIADVSGKLFRYQIIESMYEQLHLTDLGMGGNIGVSSQITNEQTRDQYYIKSLIHEAITSSQLEGAVTTREVAKEMIRTGRRPLDRSEQMILNNYRAMSWIREAKDRELDMDLIFEMHRLVTENTLDDPTAAGRFRRPHEEVCVEDEQGQVLYTPPPADLLTERMAKFCTFANSIDSKPFTHPVVRAIIIHFWLAYEHPFIDGNGRTARALFYWCMLKYGYWLFEYVSISGILLKAQKQYARAFLYTETDDNDLTYFIEYQLRVIGRAVDALHSYIDRKSGEMERLEKEIRGLGRFNHRQRAVINHALKHPYQVYTIESHQNSHGVARQTARTDLLRLSELNLLRLEKVGNAFHFHVPKKISELLAQLNTDK